MKLRRNVSRYVGDGQQKASSHGRQRDGESLDAEHEEDEESASKIGRNAIETFNGMIHRGLKPNAVTFVNLSKGCSHAGMVEDGLNYFNSMEKIYGVVPKEEHYSCAIDLLGRAGKLKEAEDFINNMSLAGVLFLGLVKFMGTWKGPNLQQTN
ncbi:hypothetical protein JHK87_006798 [Glycine soja]|nr:hypothetical protein JHK87_006798 [Glycine soja]